MNKVWRRIIALMGIAAIAFTQLALAAYACPDAAGMTAPAAAMTVPCDEADPAAPALCEKHCQDEKQKPADAAPVLAAATPASTFSLRVVNAGLQSPGADLASPALLHIKPPSFAIRNCCFRI